MKKFIKILFFVLTLIASWFFISNIFSFNYTNMDFKFLIPLIFSVIAQFICLDNFKTGKRILFVLLIALLNLITFFCIFVITGFVFPYSKEVSISGFAEIAIYSLNVINFFIVSIIHMFLINKNKADDKPKSSYCKTILIFQLIVFILDILILIWANK